MDFSTRCRHHGIILCNLPSSVESTPYSWNKQHPQAPRVFVTFALANERTTSSVHATGDAERGPGAIVGVGEPSRWRLFSVFDWQAVCVVILVPAACH